MDPHEVWQENKRWILGVVAGLLVYWVGTSIIAGVYSTSSAAIRDMCVASMAQVDAASMT